MSRSEGKSRHFITDVLAIDEELQRAVREGPESAVFRDYIKSAYQSINEFRNCDLIDDKQYIVMKLEVFNALAWLGVKLSEIERSRAG